MLDYMFAVFFLLMLGLSLKMLLSKKMPGIQLAALIATLSSVVGLSSASYQIFVGPIRASTANAINALLAFVIVIVVIIQRQKGNKHV